jgi:hypothetical protein
MKMKCFQVFLISAVFFLLPVAITFGGDFSNAEPRVIVPRKPLQEMNSKAQLSPRRTKTDLQYQKIESTKRELKALLVESPTGKLTGGDKREMQQHNKWLKSIIDRLSELGLAYQVVMKKYDNRTKTGDSPSDEKDYMAEMHELELEFIALENALQEESRNFQTLSNAMKASHDSAMSAIRNMR